MTTVNAALELLSRNLHRHPDKTAYYCDKTAISYRELDRESRRLARLLQQQGIAPGERVLLVLSDTPAFPMAFLGCLLAGAVAVAADTALTEEHCTHILKDSDARLLVTHPDLNVPRKAAGEQIGVVLCDDKGLLAPLPAVVGKLEPFQPTADDLAFMLYSSGSTGQPKGVPHRHRDLLLPCQRVGSTLLNIRAQDVLFSTSKFSFAYGLINSLAFPLFFGATAILHAARPDVNAILRLLREKKPTVFFSVPTIYSHIILSCTADAMSLPMRICYSAGEALPAAIFDEWRRLTGLEIVDGIGSTEMTYIYISNRPGQARAGSTGQPVPGYSVKLVDDHGNEVPPGTDGHLLVKGDTMAPCYWNLPEKSTATMLEDGFCRTGDVFVQQDGCYYHRGRSDDMIKAGGRWVSPVPVEEALLEHPAVAECAVAAVSAGALVKPGAFVILVPGTARTAALTRELRDHVLTRCPEYMCPVRFTFVTELPRTATGKIQRFRLRNARQGYKRQA
jgi:benzoate-CoA ligase